jgi:hypothetical protein
MGYVYIFSNTELLDVVKIGKTVKHPEVRAEQLNKQTGTIGKFKVEWFVEVRDESILEFILHTYLKDYHKTKEYFNIELTRAIEFSKKISKEYKMLSAKANAILMGYRLKELQKEYQQKK